jgi:hypothetical protein
MMAHLHPDKVIDFTCMPYKYYLDSKEDKEEEGKANPENRMRCDWPFNYVSALKEIVKPNVYEYILIPSDGFVLALLRREGMPYCLCYPERSAKDEYLKLTT